jgi:hypothetical protein
MPDPGTLVLMPERVTLTPLPDSKLREMIVQIVHRELKVTDMHHIEGDPLHEEKTPLSVLDFCQHLSLRLMSSLCEWRTRSLRPWKRQWRDWGHVVERRV